MTPCEKMGYKVGDKFKVLSSVEGFTEGQEIELYEDDGTDMPLFSGENNYHNHAGGNPGAYFPLSEVEKITSSASERQAKTNTITRLKAAHAARQAAEAEYQSALQALREELGEGFKVEAVPAGPEPEEDMNDPASWREGDLVRCVEGYGNQFEAGRIYKLRADCSESWVSVEEDDEGDPNGLHASHFEFHSRPAR